MADLVLDLDAGAAQSHVALTGAAASVTVQYANGPVSATLSGGHGPVAVGNVQSGKIVVDIRHRAFRVKFTLDATVEPTGLVTVTLAPHPRVQLTAQAHAVPGNHVGIRLLLPFVDITDVVQLATRQMHNVELRAYEHIAAPTGMPRIWCVAVPPEAAAGSRTKHNMLVMFRPEMDAYHTIVEAGLNGTFLYYMDEPPDPDKPQFVVGSSESWPPKRGWANALVASKQPVIMAYVLPPPTPANAPLTNAAGALKAFWSNSVFTFALRKFVTDFTATLGDDGLISAAREVGRVGVGCFSQSSDFAFALAAAPHGSEIDEFIMFDPKNVAADMNNVTQWFAAGGKRRLHLIGGVFHDSVMKLRNTSLNPSALSHWQDAPEYKAAFGIDGFDDELALPGKTTQLSTDTGITFDGNDVVWNNVHKLGNGCTRTEMRGMLLVKSGVRSAPPSDAAQFKQWVDDAVTRKPDEFANLRFKSLRHQWSVAGGVRIDTVFWRYLSLALLAGEWP